MIKIIVCRVGQQPTIEEVKNPWTFTKKLLADDYDKHPNLQIVTLEDGVALYSDEDGQGKNLAFNRAVPDRAKPLPPGFTASDIINPDPRLASPGERGFHHILGDFILARNDYLTDKSVSLTDDDIAKWVFTLTTPAKG